MDSQPQPDQSLPAAAAQPSPIVEATLAVATTDHGPTLSWVDWIVRLALWGGIVYTFARQLGGDLSNNEVLFPILIFALLTAGYLLASVAPVAQRLHQYAADQPVVMAFIPLALLIPFVLYGRLYGALEPIDVLTAAVLLFLPTALALLNTPNARAADIPLGLVVVAMPLLLPLTRSVSIDAAGMLLRAGAFALPLILLIVTTREQRKRLNFLFLCAVLSLWYCIEFNAFPSFALPGQEESLSYFQLAAIPLFMFILAVSGRFSGLGLSFAPSPRGLSIVTSNLVVFALIAVPVGLVTRFLIPTAPSLDFLGALSRAFSIYLFIALPEEILFRGTLLRYLGDTYRWSGPVIIVVSSLIFGASHLNNPPNIGWYFALATVAGVFYARAYLMTKNVGAAATLHTAVNWLWLMIFR